MKNFKTYLYEQKISFNKIGENIVSIGNETYEYHNTKLVNGRRIHFNDDFSLIHETECDYSVILFGGRYYRLKWAENEYSVFEEIRHIGECSDEIETECFLGIHSGNEIMSGSGVYKNWCKKANFFKTKSLGICEKNTMRGMLKFQTECKKNGIKPILGASFAIHKSNGVIYDAKVYVKDGDGWNSISTINYIVNVEVRGYIKEDDFLNNTKGLVVVLDPKDLSYEDVPIIDTEDVYYHLDTAKFVNDIDDERYLTNLNKYFVDGKIKPCSITDAYYIDSDSNFIKEVLGKMSSNLTPETTNQFFKSKEDYFMELSELFKEDDDRLYDVFEEAVLNEKLIAEKCNFEIDTTNRHLPPYEMTEEEKALYGDKETLFWSLIEEGLKNRYPDYTQEHLDRIEYEYKVLEMGNVVDYFLNTRDIVNAAVEHGAIKGLGRGSAAGSVISYLLGIVEVDPLRFDLLFERFLNEGRVKVSLPDIDLDFSVEDRPWIKEYMEKRFGETQVCSVGTYGTLQLKGAIKDLFRLWYPKSFKEVNIVTSIISKDDKTVYDLFKRASSEPKLKSFIKKYSEVFYMLPVVLNQPKSQSIHACAMMVFPREKTSQYWTPIYKNKDGHLVTEFEGGELDDSGFLKMDILGVEQLSKFKSIIHKVKDNRGIDIDIYSKDYDCEKVYEYMSKGWNGDVFQLGTSGLSDYSKKMKPDSIDDVIACVALYRPGARDNYFHEAYIKRKKGLERVDYMWGTRDILSKTYGLIVYQEQVMQICSKVAGFDLMTADSIRKALGKKILEVLMKYKEMFINGSLDRGCPSDEAEHMWEVIQEFAKYSFNLSHSACYGITGYKSQELKVKFPLEYWSTALERGSDDDVPNYLSEIGESGDIKILPPDINTSGLSLETNIKDESILWALSSIRGIGGATKKDPKGGAAIRQILALQGTYYSFEDFLTKHTYKGSKVNKTVIESLILSGAFDSLEGIKSPVDREILLKFYWNKNKVKINKEKHWYYKNSNYLCSEWCWLLEQKRLSGLAYFDYEYLCEYYLNGTYEYLDKDLMSSPISKSVFGAIGGVVIEAKESTTRNGDKFAKVIIESNYTMYTVMIWGDYYSKMMIKANNMKGKIMLFVGNAKYDSTHSNKNQLMTAKNSVIKFL
jgi:DNA polymerase-3 subunit alpha